MTQLKQWVEQLVILLTKVWHRKFRLMLLALIMLAVYSHYREHGNLFLSMFNGFGVWGVAFFGAVAYREKLTGENK